MSQNGNSISATQYAARHGRDGGTIRKAHSFPAGARVNSGKYVNWRKKSEDKSDAAE